jgi:hypothetical protein
MTKPWNRDTARVVLICCVGLPFIFLDKAWVDTALQIYFITAFLFGFLLVGEYPPLGSAGFWRALIPLVAVHSAVVIAIMVVNLSLPGINGLPRIVYGLLGVILVIEWRAALFLIERSRLNGR